MDNFVFEYRMKSSVKSSKYGSRLCLGVFIIAGLISLLGRRYLIGFPLTVISLLLYASVTLLSQIYKVKCKTIIDIAGNLYITELKSVDNIELQCKYVFNYRDIQSIEIINSSDNFTTGNCILKINGKCVYENSDSIREYKDGCSIIINYSKELLDSLNKRRELEFV